MANPNDAVGTNGAFGGRTSVNAFNDVLSAFSGRGIISGWSASPSSGLTINLGGNGNVRDVAIAEDASGNKTTVNNISQAPVQVTINAAPASNSRIDAVVAYIEDSPNGSGVTDNPDVVNILVVSGTVASSPTAPTDSAIRSAITADGASGSTAYYVVLASVRISSGTTDVDSTMIIQGAGVELTTALPAGSVGTDEIDDGAIGGSKLNYAAIPFGNYSTSEINTGFSWIDGSTIYKKTIDFGALPSSTTKTVAHGVANLGLVIAIDGVIKSSTGLLQYPLPFASKSQTSDNIELQIDGTNVQIGTSNDYWSSFVGYVTIYYVKSA